jgi:anti-sigma factor RsiW
MMTREEYEAMLADYLGDELDAAERDRFEGYLAEHADARAEVGELRATLAELAELQTVSLPTAQVASQPAARVTARRDRRSPLARFVTATAKAAAILLFGVIIGRATAPPAYPPLESGPEVAASDDAPTETVILAGAHEVHPGWIELVERLGANEASLGVQLRMLANLPR